MYGPDSPASQQQEELCICIILLPQHSSGGILSEGVLKGNILQRNIKQARTTIETSWRLLEYTFQDIGQDVIHICTSYCKGLI